MTEMQRSVRGELNSYRYFRGEFEPVSGDFGAAPLHLAVHYGLYDMTKLLLEHGADPLITTWGANQTALRKVLMGQSVKKVDVFHFALLLLTYNAEPTFVQDDDSTLQENPKLLILLKVAAQLWNRKRLDNLLDGRWRNPAIDANDQVCSLHALVGQRIWRSLYAARQGAALGLVYGDYQKACWTLTIPRPKLDFLRFGYCCNVEGEQIR